MKKINFRKGAGEYVAFSVIAPMVCVIVIMICAYIQLSVSIKDITNALSVASRSAAVCTSMEDAEKQALLVAEASISSHNISDIAIEIHYADGYSEWEKGSIIVVTIYADVKTVAPYITSGTRSKSMVVTIENSLSE